MATSAIGLRGSLAIACWVLSIFSPHATATTWAEPEEIPDPIKKGATCAVARPMSSGSYIYQWPSKYDQVFWPLIDEHAIWFCSKSGFAAFLGDFELTKDEVTAVAEHLDATYKPKAGQLSLKEKLQQLQLSYSVRAKDEAFGIRLQRVLAFYQENDLGDAAAATNLRKIALAMMETALAGNLPERQRLEYLFVIAAYSREFGDLEKSDAARQKLRTALQANRDEKLQDYVTYLAELEKEVASIEPGGVLAPIRQR